MRSVSMAMGFALMLCCGGAGSAQTPSSAAASPMPAESYFSAPPNDAPELAARGPYAVGVRTLELKNPGQVDVLNFDKATGKAPLYDRPLTVEVWYPATVPTGQLERTDYEMVMPGAPPPQPIKKFLVPGKALRNAPAVEGKQFPLVIVSHGYPGSRFFLSYLTENLASKGYVVAAIDHTDSVLGAVKPFPSTLLNRSADQLFTIGALEELSRQSGNFLHGLMDDANVAIVGYSMGGYGALASGGAGYSQESMVATTMVPGGYLKTHTAGNAVYEGGLRKEVKALVAISPWGAQPPYNAWDASGLAGIHLPLLMIAGDQDDVSDFANGMKSAFEKIVNSDRCFLVYENARHNVGGNPPPPEALGSFTTREYFDEPVWRKDRITAINQHFITAFLDLHLKSDASRSAYLHLTSEKSNAGTWPLKQGESAGAKYSEGGTYWKGFQRRWAVGLEMKCEAATAK